MYLSKAKGFTLIELLVVMVLMSLSLSIVLPITVNQVDAARQRAERQLCAMFFQQVHNSSFFLARPIEVTASGRMLTATAKDYQKQLALEYTAFTEQTVIIMPGGLAEPLSLKAYINEKAWQLVIDNEQAAWSDAD
ncbi:MAG: prepilin-type N-terminal cleavage/methylation domain-containing protein [Gammaproteobacteria bacterium]|nr:prepilin-type N-terminal cleavage/methylation domain-containing protein [Gammaproteobacteria bacterium]MBU1555799.1 prepilin-type N-terminal cleavage/methylation domain-containing protein [Gammaproteobacteria bacterium]MBU2069675.1 prepilin-type N-terminal cleavage/methylation domain-containing protein [Gammaproteobacteria bacterium]MBU2184540.1 prepilin-type N-terminal cleavage/methylation domain-containing protein [Gammaproteobacteria bacterium]MBU2205222.1 prepilin-type N-terminal cleavag